MPLEDSYLLQPEADMPRTMMLIFAIDTSQSISETRMAAVNKAMEEMLSALASVQHPEAEIQVALLRFSDTCEWLTPTPVSPQEVVWKSLTPAGTADFGEMCRELVWRMHRKDLFSSLSGSYVPSVILLSNGVVQDEKQYYAELEKLRENNWFRIAFRYAVFPDFDGDTGHLRAFTGGTNTVLPLSCMVDELLNRLRFIKMETPMYPGVPPVSQFSSAYEEDLWYFIAGMSKPPKETDYDW